MKAKSWLPLCMAAVFLIGVRAHAQDRAPVFSATSDSEEGAPAPEEPQGPLASDSKKKRSVPSGGVPDPGGPSDTDSMTLNLETRWTNALGHGMFWPGVITSLAGIVLIEVDSQGKIGVAGAITAGIGVATMAAGSAVLGLAYLLPRVYALSRSSVSVAPLRNGAVLGYSRAF